MAIMHMDFGLKTLRRTSDSYILLCVFFHSSQWTSSVLSNMAAAPAHSTKTPTVRPEDTEVT